MTTDPNLEEIRAREAAATPGPLDIDIRGRLTGIRARDGRDLVVMCVQGDDVEAGFRSRPDAVFFAHARTDIPALLALVESQAARVAELEGEVVRLRTRADELHSLCTERNEAWAGGVSRDASLLHEVEWVRDAYDDHSFCLFCNAPKDRGHGDSCRAFGKGVR